MKKAILLLSLLISMSVSFLQAQETSADRKVMRPKNEIGLSSGYSLFLHNYYMTEDEAHGFNRGYWFNEDIYRGPAHYFGVHGISYMHNHTWWFAQGAEFFVGGNYVNIYDIFTDDYLYRKKDINYVFFYTARFNYMSRTHVSLYGSASIGFMLETSGDRLNWATFMGQACPIGITVGGEHFRLFAEIGLGGKGIARAGLSYAFGK